jgi:hypothetical protein
MMMCRVFGKESLQSGHLRLYLANSLAEPFLHIGSRNHGYDARATRKRCGRSLVDGDVLADRGLDGRETLVDGESLDGSLVDGGRLQGSHGDARLLLVDVDLLRVVHCSRCLCCVCWERRGEGGCRWWWWWWWMWGRFILFSFVAWMGEKERGECGNGLLYERAERRIYHGRTAVLCLWGGDGCNALEMHQRMVLGILRALGRPKTIAPFGQ